MRKLFLLLAAALVAASSGSLHAQTYTPVAVGGFNHDLFAESGSDATVVTDTVLDATNHIMYTQAFAAANGLSAGLPDNGIIADASNTHIYQLNPYSGPNALTLMRNVTRTLTVSGSTSYSKLSVLAFSAEGASSINLSLQFSDGSSTNYLSNYSLSDWFFASSNVVVSGFGRIARLAAPPYTVDGLPSNPRFYYIDFVLNCTDARKSLSGITISNASTTGANPFPNTAILAVSGITGPTSVTGSQAARCGQANGSATIDVTGNSGPYSYNWVGMTPAQTGTAVSGLATGNYTVVVTDGFGCQRNYSIWVGSIPAAVVTAGATPPAICAGSSSQLTATATGGSIATATWNPGALSGAAVTVSPNATTPYTVSGTDGNGCAYSASVTLSVTPNLPPPAPQAAGATICAGQPATLTVQNPNILYTYNWYSAASGGSALASGLSYTTPPLGSGSTYYVEAVLPCASSTRTAVPVTVTPVPAAPAVNGTSVCAGTSATLQVSGPVPGTTYNWYDAASGGTLLSTGSSYSTPVLNGTATYYVDAASGSCVSSSRSTVTVTITPRPAAPIVSPASVCTGNAATLAVLSPDPSLQYSWYAVASGGTPLSGSSNYTTPALASNTTYYVEAVTGGNCASAARTAVPVTVTPGPAMPAAADATICINTPAVLSVQNPQSSVTYEWYTAPNAGTLLFTGPVFTTPVLSVVTTYYLEARIGTCIMGRPPVTVNFLPQLPAPVVSAVASGSSATFTWSAVPGAVGYEVSGNGGATWTAPSSGPTGTTHVLSGLLPGVAATLQVRVLAGDPCANSAAGAATAIISSNDVFVPNVFTPNGDGRNDDLLVYGTAIATMDFRIFDQWGNELFHSTDKDKGWNGTYRGQRAPVGVYVYALRAVLVDGTIVSKKGSVNLLR
ncbi:gliding motility-associated C-terminal domain-containing protein [Flaviaesturariibacter terrae]